MLLRLRRTLELSEERVDGESEEETTEGAALVGAAKAQDLELRSEEEDGGARVEEVGDTGERGELLSHLVEQLLLSYHFLNSTRGEGRS